MYHNVLDVQVIRSRYHYGWYDNVLDVLVDDTAYFNPQAAVWPTRPEVEWTITATNNRTGLIQNIRYLSYYKTYEHSKDNIYTKDSKIYL